MIRRAVAWLFGPPLAARDAAQIEALTERLAQSEAARFALVAQLAEACMERDDAMAFANISGEILTRRTEALRRIAARVTASPNAASRDMARIAREALE